MIRHRTEGERGAISVMAAVMVMATLVATSLAVDVGRIAYVSRDQQGATDRAVLDAIHMLEDHSAATLTGLWDEVQDEVLESMDRNPESGTSGGSRALAGVVLGMVQDATDFVAICGTRPPDEWFDPAPAPLPSCADIDAAGTYGAADVTAIEVYVGSAVPFLFALGADEGGREIHKSATGAIGDPIGAVSAATSEVELNDGLVTLLLSELLGADAQLSLVGWNGLATTDVTLRDIAARVNAGTIDQLLSTQLTVGELADVLADVLAADSDTTADVQATLLELANATLGVGLGPVSLGELLVVDRQAGASALDTSVDAAGLLLGFAQLANKEHGVAMDLSALGVAGVTASVIEAPQIAIGRPGQDDLGNWRTQAHTAQVRLDVALPLADVATSAVPTNLEDSEIDAEVQSFRDRIDAIPETVSGCFDALEEGNTSIDGSIASDLEEALEAVRAGAQQLGLLTSAISDTIDGTLSLLGGLLNGLGCALVLTAPSTAASIKADLLDAVTEYETLLDQLSGTTATTDGGTAPVLSVQLASGDVALSDVRCTEPMEGDTFVEGDAASITLTNGDALLANAADPAEVPVQLLDVDLGLLGSVSVTIGGDVSLGASSDTLTFLGPWAADAQVLNAASVGAGTLLSSLQVDATETQVLGLPLGDAATQLLTSVTTSLDGILGEVDLYVLAPLLDVLGVDLGNVHARVLDADCEGPPRLLPRVS